MILRIVTYLIGLIAIVATVVPLVRQDQWWIRIFDFPRLQILFLAIVAIALNVYLVRRAHGWLDVTLLVLVAAAAVYQMVAIFPYTAVARNQVDWAPPDGGAARLKLVVSNVLMHNDEVRGLLEEVDRVQPDIVLTVETDEAWMRRLEPLEETYPHVVREPLDNTYGMILYSRLALEDLEVKYLLEPDVPSIHAYVTLSNGEQVRLYLVHPKPPAPQEAETTRERDAELLIVGREVEARDEPAIVAGDLNDVAWSRTTRLFQRISGMLDPRIGRGMYNTFHAGNPLMRWPLDHVFHTSHFKVAHLERLKHYGSDHFPIFIELVYDYDAPMEQVEPRPEEGDREEAEEKIEEGKNGD